MMRPTVTLFAGLVAVYSAISVGLTLNPPVAKRIPWHRVMHGENVTDWYYWIRNIETDGDVLTYIEAENNYTTAVMDHTRQLQIEIANEMTKRYVDTDDRNTTFWQQGTYTYYYRTEGESIYSIYCRRKDGVGPEEIVLDLNDFTSQNISEFLAIGVFEVSPDENLLAFSLDRIGDERYSLYFKDLVSGEILNSLTITDTYYHLRWAQSSNTTTPYVFFTTLDWLGLPRFVYRYKVHSLKREDLALVYNATTDDGYYTVQVTCTNDDRYLLINLYTDTDNSVFVLPADRPLDAPYQLYPHQRNVRYDVEHHNGSFIIRTNGDGTPSGGVTHPNFRVVVVGVTDPSATRWTELIPQPGANRWIDLVESFSHHLAIWFWEDGLRNVYIREHVGSENMTLVKVPLDHAFIKDGVYSMLPGTSSDLDDRRYRSFHTTDLVYSLRSLTRPVSVYSFAMSGPNQHVTKKIAEDTSAANYGYDPSLYTQKRIWATADDGARIPISLIYRTALFKNGQNGGNPMFLHGYGAYGGVGETQFDQDFLALLDRGVIVGFAHPRGDGDLGTSWWTQGRVLTKKNTFTDFIRCAEHLIQQGYTSSDRLAAQGRSAGGLLAGSLLVLKPSVFKVVIAGVPFLDAITTEADITIPWAQWEWLEWGNPYDREVYEYMKTYSPYDNIDKVSLVNFPNVLVTSGLNDPRVKYYEPTKFVAKLRAHIAQQKAIGNITKEPRVVLATDNAGHFGATSLDGHVAAQAYMFAFILDAVAKPTDVATETAWYVYASVSGGGVLALICIYYMYRQCNEPSSVMQKPQYHHLATSSEGGDNQVNGKSPSSIRETLHSPLSPQGVVSYASTSSPPTPITPTSTSPTVLV